MCYACNQALVPKKDNRRRDCWQNIQGGFMKKVLCDRSKLSKPGCLTTEVTRINHRRDWLDPQLTHAGEDCHRCCKCT